MYSYLFGFIKSPDYRRIVEQWTLDIKILLGYENRI